MTFWKRLCGKKEAAVSGNTEELLKLLEDELQALTNSEDERENFRTYVASLGVAGVVDYLLNGMEITEDK